MPVFAIWALAWFRRGRVVGWQPGLLIVATLVMGWLQLTNKAVKLYDFEIVQGWPPFRTRIAYHDISRVHHIFVSSRYASASCLAISSAREDKKIVLPLKSFGPEKRRRLMRILEINAPQARIDPNLLK
jgi:hypothetical protein